jgi:hypothetical protein
MSLPPSHTPDRGRSGASRLVSTAEDRHTRAFRSMSLPPSHTPDRGRSGASRLVSTTGDRHTRAFRCRRRRRRRRTGREGTPTASRHSETFLCLPDMDLPEQRLLLLRSRLFPSCSDDSLSIEWRPLRRLYSRRGLDCRTATPGIATR